MDQRFGTAPRIKVDGNWVEGELGVQFLRAVVVDDLNGPSSCEVVFADPARNLLDAIGVDFGQPIEIHASAVEDRAEHPIFTGRVFGLEFQADEAGCVSILQGYDATYALRQRRAITAYNDVTDADLVRTLCGEAGVEVGDIEGGDTTHAYIAQFNETHWEFLWRRAAANGAHLHATDGKVHFTPIVPADDAPEPGDHQSSDPLQLTPGLNLLYLRARLSAAQQVEEVEVRGWNPGEKVEVVAREPVATRTVDIGTDPADVASANGTPLRVAGRPQLTDEAPCRSLARSLAERVATSFAYLEAKAYGDPSLAAGKPVALGRTGRFDGRYTLTSVRHVFDQDGFFSYLTVTGEHDRSVFGLLAGRDHTSGSGLWPAVVTNINDPDTMGRVKVRFPWLADDFESNWSRVVQIGAGADRGLLLFPEVDDEVLVTFVDGDVSHPIVVGGLYNGIDTPPAEGFEDTSDGTVDVRGLKSRVGHSVLLRDKGGEESITIETGDASVTVTLDQAGGGAVVVEASGDVDVTAGGNVTVEAGGNLEATATGNVVLESGGELTVKAGANLTLEAGGMVEVKGAVINLN